MIIAVKNISKMQFNTRDNQRGKSKFTKLVPPSSGKNFDNAFLVTLNHYIADYSPTYNEKGMIN